MLIEFPYARSYLFTALESGPTTVAALVDGVTAELADFRPDAERFTIREVVAHLADWEPIWMLRMRAVCEQDEPTMPGYDVTQLAIDHDYAHSDVAEQAILFAARRQEMIAYLKDRAASDWSRRLNRPEIGWLTLEGLATLVPLHDLYHSQQIVEWKKAFRS